MIAHEIPGLPDIVLPNVNMPSGYVPLILFTLLNPHAKPDHALVLADALDQYAAALPPTHHMASSVREAAKSVRDYAPHLDLTNPPTPESP